MLFSSKTGDFYTYKRKVRGTTSDFFYGYTELLDFSTVTLEITLGREFGKHESAWGSNPPAKLVTPPTRFEDEDSHRATSALV